MFSYARLTPGRGFKPGRALLYYAQRLVTFPTPRRFVARLIAAWVNWMSGSAPAGCADSYSARVLEDLERDGVARLAPLTTRAAIGRMATYFMQQPVIGPDGRASLLRDLPADAAAAPYALDAVVRCPGLIELVNSPSVIEIAAAYIGCKPTISSLGVRWSFPTSEKRAAFHTFHRDVDDWRFLKLFIYLTDVDAESGPHCYVRTSHRSAFRPRGRGYRHADLKARFGADKMHVVTGPRGTTFLADTLGVHCGEVPRSRARLLLQVQYSLLPVFAFRYAPGRPPADAPAVDAYSNRLLFRGVAAQARPIQVN